jgi:hypothetical protein
MMIRPVSSPLSVPLRLPLRLLLRLLRGAAVRTRSWHSGAGRARRVVFRAVSCVVGGTA